MPQNPDKTYLAIDYGTKRIGLAKTDPMGIIASALMTLEVKSVRDALGKIKECLEEYKPSALIIGYPRLKSGDKSDKCREIDSFVDKIREFYHAPIHLVDEDYTSQEAAKIVQAHGKKSGADKKRIDRLAAVLILQRFLDEVS